MAVLSCGVVPVGSRPLVRALVALVFLIVTASRAGAQAPKPAPARPGRPTSVSAPPPARSASACTTSATRARSRSSWWRKASASRPTSPTTTTTSTAWSPSATWCSSPRRAASRPTRPTSTPGRARGRSSTPSGRRRSATRSTRASSAARSRTRSSMARRSRRSASTGTASTRVAFTTCVQPTPRWEVAAGTVTLTVDKRAVLKHAVLKVKDVPLFYVPAMYYPINKEDRSTGFLLPVYGTSTIRGTSFSNAFFWAINRSQDVTADARLVHQDRPGLRRRVPLRRGGGVERRVPHVSPQRAREHVPAERHGHHPAGPQELRDPHQRGAEPSRGVQGPGQRRLLQRRDGPAAVSDGPLQRDAAHPQLSGQRVGLARPGQLDQRDLRHQRDLLRRRRLTDDRRHAAHPVQPGPDQARGAAALLHRQRRVRQHRPLRQLRRRQDQRPGPDPLRHQPLAAVPADEVAVPVGALVDHVAEHLLDRERRHQPAPGRRAALPTVLRHARQRHRPDPDQGLADAGHRLRRALQARRRTGVRGPAHHPVRRLRPDRQDRPGRLRLRRHHPGDLRRDEPLPRPPAGRRGRGPGAARPRVPQHRAAAVLLLGRARQHRRRRLRRRLLRQAAEQFLADRVVGAGQPHQRRRRVAPPRVQRGGRRVRDHPGKRHRQPR